MKLLPISAALHGIILMHMIAGNEGAWSDCTSPSSNIECSVSDNSGDCDGRDSNLADQSIIPNVEDLTAEPFTEHGNDYNGVVISWRTPSAMAMNATTGYILKLYRQQSPRTGELCRYFKVGSTESALSVNDVKGVFSYKIDRLEVKDMSYIVELYTLPFSSLDYADFELVYFFSSSSLTPPPVDYLSVMNLTADNSNPYTLSGGFRRSSSFDNLKDIEKYKFAVYDVALVDNTGTPIKGITGEPITKSIEPDGAEFALFSLTGLLPGLYRLRVIPFDSCPEWDDNCFPRPVNDNIGELNITVKGADYHPSKPTLTVSETNDVAVSFEVAPRDRYITRYFVKLFDTDGTKELIKEVLPSPEAQDSWYTHDFVIESHEILKEFEKEDLIHAEVIPQLDSSLCPNRGECNLNGTCTECSREISHEQPLISEQATTNIATPANLLWIIGIVAGAILIIVLLTLVIIYKRKRIPTTGFLKCFKDGAYAPHSQTTRPPLNDFNVIHSGKVTVCIAYPSGAHYQEFNKLFRSVLENHFNCEVMIYNGDPSNPDAYKHCDYVIVVYSPQLLGTHYFFLQQPSVVPMEQKQHKTVLDLVLKPQPLSSPAVLFVTFDNVSPGAVNSLVSGNSSLRIFKLPTDWRLLFAELYNSNNTMTLNESMEYYEAGPLKECLDTAVDMITSSDSGLGDLENDTQTVYTGLQHDDRYGSNYYSNLQSTTPKAYEQRFLPTRQDSVDQTLASASPAEYPPIPDVSVTGYTEVEEPSFVPQPNHYVVDETRKPNGTHVHDSVDSGSGSDFRRGSNECESIPASEDSYNCSDLTSSVFPGRSVGPESYRQTYEC